MPDTPEEWQSAVDWAELLLTLESVEREGLIITGHKINVERCKEILEEGAARGFTPTVQNELTIEYLELE